MKRIFSIALLVVLCFTFTACEDKKDKELLAERSIDGIAQTLGYTDGEKILDPGEVLPGAIDAKDFANSQVIIYEFIPESAEYKEIQKQSTICNGGFVLMIGNSLSNGEIADLIDKFERIKFE